MTRRVGATVVRAVAIRATAVRATAVRARAVRARAIRATALLVAAVAAAGTLGVVLATGPAARAESAPVAITGVQASTGRVEFFLAVRDLPGGTPLARATVTVYAGETLLPSTVRTVATSGRTAPRRAVVLVLDASGSMAGPRIAAARAAALDYAATAPPDVWLGLVTVSDRPTVALAPTADRAAFTSAVRRIVARGKTALYDGVLAAEALLDPTAARRGRRQAIGGSPVAGSSAAGSPAAGTSAARTSAAGTSAAGTPAARTPAARTPAARIPAVGASTEPFAERRVVVLSDGADTASTMSAEDLSRRLAAADATVDAVAFGEADRVRLATLTGATGGRVLPAGDPAALRGILRAMAARLSAPVVVTATVPPALGGQATTLRVRVSGGGGTVTGTASVRFRVDPGAGTAPRTFRAPGAGSGGLTVALAALAGALFLAVLLAVAPLTGRTDAQRRLGQLDRFSIGRRASMTASGATSLGGSKGASGGPMLQAALAMSERVVRRPGRRERIELALDRAGSPLRAAEWQLIRTGVTVGVALLLALVLPWWVGLPVGALIGWWGAGRYLRARAARRTRKFADQLPDALQLVVGSLRSGFSLPQSIDSLVREGADPVAGELGRALSETRLGGDLEDSLERVGERNASQDMIWLVMAIRIQREVGGNLSETLETAVNTMRERGRLVRHVRTLSAEGRLSAMILLGMPIVLGGWMFVFRRDYLRPLYTEPLGLAMLVGAVVMVGLGALWLRKLVQVEV